MATPAFDLGVNLSDSGVNAIADYASSDMWTLGCTISAEDIDATMREVYAGDIELSGDIFVNSIEVGMESEIIDVIYLEIHVCSCGVSSGEGGGGTGGGGGCSCIVDTEMSDISENAVQNKVIKAYADLHSRYEQIESIIPPDEVEDYATKDWVRKGFLTPSSLKTINGESLVGEGDITIEAGTDIEVDTAMSDISENAVQNKVIKEYVDLHPRYEQVDEIVPPEEVEDYATKEWVKSQDYTTSSSFKTVNGESIIGTGNIVIEVGGIASESDPIFSASPAANIKSSDIANWNKSEANVQSDWNVTDSSSDAFIKNKPSLSTVATSGDYNDLSNKPIIPAPITIDTEMSDTSDNAVRNKTIKAYADLHSKYKVIEEITPPEGGGSVSIVMDTEMSDDSENAVQNKVIKKYVDDSIANIDIDTSNLTNVKYEELVDMMMRGQLIAGHKYRIIDYVTTTKQEGTMSVKGQYDIIVTALDEWLISEDALAMDAFKVIYNYPDFGSIYAWKLKYSFFPFWPYRFDWACMGNEYVVEDDGERVSFYRVSSIYTEEVNGKQCYLFVGVVMGIPIITFCDKANPEVGDMLTDGDGAAPISEIIPHEEGKGVVYELTDEWGNTAPYDFKNIKFKVYGASGGGFSFSPIEGGSEEWVYTFEGGDFDDASRIGIYETMLRSSTNLWIHYDIEVCNNKIRYFPYKLKPIICYGSRLFQEDDTADSLTMGIRIRCSNNEFSNCENLVFTANSNCILRNCENVDFSMPEGWLSQDIQMDNIHIDRLKGEEGNPIVIENLSTSEDYTTHIGKNSQGEVKIWNPADLV